MQTYLYIVVAFADLRIIEEWTIRLDRSLHSPSALLVGVLQAFVLT